MNEPYIGMGKAPDGIDIPLGLGMHLMQEPRAAETFGALSKERKAGLIRYVQAGSTGEEAKSRIIDAVARLRDGDAGFF